MGVLMIGQLPVKLEEMGMEHPSNRLAKPAREETADQRYNRLLKWDRYCQVERELAVLRRISPLSNSGVRIRAKLMAEKAEIESA